MTLKQRYWFWVQKLLLLVCCFLVIITLISSNQLHQSGYNSLNIGGDFSHIRHFEPPFASKLALYTPRKLKTVLSFVRKISESGVTDYSDHGNSSPPKCRSDAESCTVGFVRLRRIFSHPSGPRTSRKIKFRWKNQELVYSWFPDLFLIFSLVGIVFSTFSNEKTTLILKKWVSSSYLLGKDQNDPFRVDRCWYYHRQWGLVTAPRISEKVCSWN